MASERRLRAAFDTEDIRKLARQRLPRFVFDLVDGGAGEEITLRANREAFDAVALRPRNAVAVGDPDLSTTVLGERVAAPILVAPCGSAGQLHPDGETALARAASRLGTGYVMPHLGGQDLAAVRAAADGLLWYQLYLMSDREREWRAAERAWAAGYKALVITVDTPAQGVRERDYRNGLGKLLGGNRLQRLSFLPRLLAKPGWFRGLLKGGATIGFPNMNVPGLPPLTPAELLASTSQVRNPATWEDIRALRAVWPGPIVVKGVLTAEDACRARDSGAQAVIVSNHGGRQLDSAPASLRVLPEIAAAVGNLMEVYLDSGVRRGWDVAKALGLGARAVFVGRPAMFGLAAGGEAGVDRALGILFEEYRRTLLLLGRRSSQDLDLDCVICPWVADTMRRATAAS